MKNKIIPATVLAFALISAMNACEDYKIKQEEKAGKIKSLIEKPEFENVFVPNEDIIELEDKTIIRK